MSYELLVTIVVINALFTFSLWRKLGTNPNRPRLNKKAAKALWDSDPIVPRHNPPKAAGGEYSSSLHDVDRRFFADFKDFADVVNWWLADDFTKSRFRLQDLPDSDLSLNVDFDHGPMLGRSFAIYHNQTRIGRLEIHPDFSNYNTENPEVRTNLEIDWSRFFGFGELTEFLWAIAMHVTSQRSKSNERIAAGQSINTALTKTLWDNYRVSQYDSADDQDWGDFELSFQGTANFYIDRRDAPARVRARPASGSAASDMPAKKPGVAAPLSRKQYSTNTIIVAGILVVLVLLGIVFGIP